MACGMIVQIPVSGSFGSDEDFDRRTQLERELGAALAAERAGECGRGGIEGGRMCVRLEEIADPTTALRVVKDVLSRLGVLPSAVVLLETRSELDPDDLDRQVLWSVPHSEPVCVA